MKKIYILIVCFLPLLALAQPTITQSDLPYAGVAWIMASNSSYTGAVLAGGADQTWDYTSLADSTTDTTAFLSAAGTPYVDTFPSANAASYDPSNGSWIYYTTNSSGLYLDGGDASGILFKYNPTLLYVPVPFGYTNTNNSYARAQVDEVVDTLPERFVTYITNDIVADGWGTLNIPSGSFPNTLREKVTQVTTDSIFIDFTHTGNYFFVHASSSQTVTYRWIRNSVAGSTYLLGIDADSAGTTATSSEYYLSNFVLSTKDLTAQDNSLHVYPNPASGNVHFALDGNTSNNGVIKVYDALGQQIISIDIKGINYLDLPVDKLANGIYYYSLIADNNKQSGKFSVAH